MYVKENIKDEVYKGVVSYFFNKCDVVSFTYRPDQHDDNTQKLKKILSELHYSQSFIERNYSCEFIGEFFKKNKDNHLLFDNEYKNSYEKHLKNDYNGYRDFKTNLSNKSMLYDKYDKYNIKIDLDNLTFEEYKKFIVYDKRLNYIWSIFSRFFYTYKVKKILDKYKDNMIYKEVNSNGGKITNIRYFFKITKNLQKNIIKKNSIFDWCYPNSIEDICFYNNGFCRLFSVAHEKMLDIFCKDEEEYNHLKTIGVKFYNDVFIPTKKDDMIFEKYIDAK